MGSHGVGKTTICYELVTSLKKLDRDAKVLEEMATVCPLPINEETTTAAQRWILFTQLAKEIELEGRLEYLICDRSILDNYVYHLNKFGRDDSLEPMIMDHMKTYAHLFKVPINPEYLTSSKKVRSLDPVFQREIDELLDRELKERGIHFHNYVSLEETLKIILGDEYK